MGKVYEWATRWKANPMAKKHGKMFKFTQSEGNANQRWDDFPGGSDGKASV